MSSDSDSYEGSTDVTKLISTGVTSFLHSYRPKEASDDSDEDYLFKPQPSTQRPPIPIDAPSTSAQGVSNDSDEPVVVSQKGYNLRTKQMKTRKTRSRIINTPPKAAETPKPPTTRKRGRPKKSIQTQAINTKKRKSTPPPGNPFLIHEISTDDDGIAADPNPMVSITVLWQSVETKVFRLKKFTKFDVIFNHFVKEKHAHPRLLLFSIEDKVVDIKGQTYAGLRMTDETILEAGLLPDSYLEKENQPVQATQQKGLEFKVQYNNKKTFKFHLLPTDKLDVLYSFIIQDTGKDFGSFKVLFDGTVVTQKDTVESLELEEFDQFDVVFT